MMARTTVITDELTDAMCELVEAGLPIPVAGEAVGASRATVREWLRRSEDRDDRPNGDAYATFATRVRAANARAMADAVRDLLATANNRSDWRAHAWFLERSWPHIYGNRVPEAQDDRDHFAARAFPPRD